MNLLERLLTPRRTKIIGWLWAVASCLTVVGVGLRLAIDVHWAVGSVVILFGYVPIYIYGEVTDQ